MLKQKRKKTFIIFIVILGVSQILLWGLLLYLNWGKAKTAKIGVTFAPAHAQYFGLNPRDVLRASLDDLGIKKYRISAYWNKIEPAPGVFNFWEVDWQLDEIEHRNGSVVLAIGRRLPRWPECHDPGWLKGASKEAQQARVLNMLKRTVEYFKGRKVIEAWQVENEPLLSVFGDCPAPDIDFLKKEVELVRSLDNRPIVMTESGELSTWSASALMADRIGISIYKTTWSPGLGISSYPLTSIYYKHRARALSPLVDKIYVSELQAEPWERTPLPKTPILEQKVMMNEDKIEKGVEFAKRAGFDEMYLWGLEWWYWLKTQGDSGVWETIKELVKN